MKRSRPYIIGLTGGIASGKSNIARALVREGAYVIDTDKISHSLTQAGGAALPLLRARFGDGMFDGEQLNRKRFGDRVFADKESLQALNAILHPMIRAEVERRIEENKDLPALVIDVPLLYEVGWDSMCDEVWCAYAPVYEQIRRLMRRVARLFAGLPPRSRAAACQGETQKSGPQHRYARHEGRKRRQGHQPVAGRAEEGKRWLTDKRRREAARRPDTARSFNRSGRTPSACPSMKSRRAGAAASGSGKRGMIAGAGGMTGGWRIPGMTGGTPAVTGAAAALAA